MVDYTSGREGCLLAAGLSCLFFSGILCLEMLVGSAGLSRLLIPGITALLGAALLFLRASIRDYRVVDGKQRKIWLHRSILGRKSLAVDADFSECRALRMEGRYHQDSETGFTGHYWELVVRLADGRKLKMTDGGPRAVDGRGHPCPQEEALRVGHALSTILGLPLETHAESPPA